MYVLEISVNPGGCRKGDFYLINTKIEIENIIRNDFINDQMSVYLSCWYGSKINVYVLINEKVSSVINMNDHITLHVNNFHERNLVINKNGVRTSSGSLVSKTNGLRVLGDFRDIIIETFDSSFDVKVDIDMSAIPNTENEKFDDRRESAEPNRIKIQFPSSTDEVNMRYGYHDLENGYGLE